MDAFGILIELLYLDVAFDIIAEAHSNISFCHWDQNAPNDVLMEIYHSTPKVYDRGICQSMSDVPESQC